MAKSIVTWKLNDSKKFARDLAKMKAVTQGVYIERALRAGVYLAIGYTKVNIRNRDLIKVGFLLNSVTEDSIYVSKNKGRVRWGPHAVYAAIHEFGGTILSTSGRGLHFVIDGHHIVTMSVTIPARPYLRPVIDEHRRELLDTITENLRIEVEAAYAS